MWMRITARLLAWAITQLVLSAGPALGSTVDIVRDGYGAYEVATVGVDPYTVEAEAGLYRLNKTGDTGGGSMWRNGPIAGFCVELNQAAPHSTTQYAVGMPDDMTVSYTGAALGTTKASYLRELWGRYYDPAWAQYRTSAEANRSAAAFAVAVWEIVYENASNTDPRWDVTVDGTPGAGGFLALNVDTTTANRWLQSLTGSGPKADLRVFSSSCGQEYLVAVPEPATIVLLGLGGLCGLRRRRRQP